MKGTPQAAYTNDSYNEGNTTASNDSDDEHWEDKLVIDLEANNMSNNTDSKPQAKPSTPPADQVEDMELSDIKPASNDNSITKNARSENTTPIGKSKGKRGGQKKANNDKSDSSSTSSTSSSKGVGKPAKQDKEKAAAGKPGRKKKEKQTTSAVKTEPTVDIKGEDPYKFEGAVEEKIAGTVSGKAGRGKVKGEQKMTKDAQTEYDWRSVGVVTEPENLGPCEPGTQVCLEGIVWQETNNGVLVVNVTWKGKTYMGTLLDATKHDWSPPSCDSPTGDFEGRTPKGRGKRSRVPLSDTFKDINERKLRKEMRKQSSQARPRSSPSPPKLDGGKRKGRSSEGDTSEPTSKRGRATSNGLSANPQSPPARIKCPEPNCDKEYKQLNGLKYHQRSAHPEGPSPQIASDSASEGGADKRERVSSPEDTTTKTVNSSNTTSDSHTLLDRLLTPPNSKVNTSNITSGPPLLDQLLPTPPNNATSVITATPSNLTNATLPQSSNVPVATIQPQVVKPSNGSPEADHNRISNPMTSTSNRSVAISAPPKLISKSSANNSMAPISTITSPTPYNSTLKAIQPKPTIMGEATPKPVLHDLIDQKKLKRRRASKEELNPPAYPHLGDSPKLAPMGSIHKFDTEHRGLLSAGGMINSVEANSILQSPSYSDISEDGEIKSSTSRRELLSAGRAETGAYSQSLYKVATVSPQKNGPQPDNKRPMSRNTPSHSPAPIRSLDDKQKPQNHSMQQLFAPPAPWPSMNPEFIHSHFLQMEANRASKDKSSNLSMSPKPNSYKNSGPPTSIRDLENRANNDRLQLLKESADMKSSRHSTSDGPRDYSLSPNHAAHQSTAEFMMYQEQKQREAAQEHMKREMIKNMSPSGLKSLSASSSNNSKHQQNDNRFEKMVPRSSPMPHPGNFVSPFGIPANAFLPMLTARGLSGLSPMFPGYPNLPGMPMDAKDNRNSTSPSFGGKPGHKIHELADGMQSKSPRPSSSSDRHNMAAAAAKSQALASQTAQTAAIQSAMFSQLSAQGIHPGMASLFCPPK